MGRFFLSYSYPYFSIIALFQNKIQTGAVETYFFQNIPGILGFATLTLEILQKTKASQGIPKNFATTVWEFQDQKTKTHGNST